MEYVSLHLTGIMKISYKAKETVKILDLIRSKGKSIGFVPTMGALHQGHLSLVDTAARENDFVAVSIFVNPTQFNDPNDLAKYPRDLDADIKKLEQHRVDLIFAPGESEIYPEKDTRTFDLSPLDTVMEGKYRPGHFNGVAQVVSKLFSIIKPHRAYFGRKDFQQVVVIRRLVNLLNMDISIIDCPIVREPDGLAMSSRNLLLTEEQRKAAPLISRTLFQAREMVHEADPPRVKAYVTETINQHPLLQIEYFEIVDDQSLKPVSSWADPVNKVGCIAVQLVGVRLIDNVYFN